MAGQKNIPLYAATNYSKAILAKLTTGVVRELARIEISLDYFGEDSSSGHTYEFSAVFNYASKPLFKYTSPPQRVDSVLTPTEQEDIIRYHVVGLEREFIQVATNIPFVYPAQGAIQNISFVTPKLAPAESKPTPFPEDFFLTST